MSLTVLYVCTGNVCRSPMAELMVRAWVAPDADVRVASAGMQALVGEQIDYSSASALGELGIDPSAHRAQQYEATMAFGANLVLTAERAHRDRILTELPTALHRTFTIKEFARLTRHLTPGEPREVIARAALIRGVDGGIDPELDDTPDPFRDEIGKARIVAAQISASVRATIAALGLDRPPLPAPVPTARRPLPYRTAQ